VLWQSADDGELIELISDHQGVFNIVDYAAVSFPTGIFADKKLDQRTSQTEALSEVDGEIQNDCKLTNRLKAGCTIADRHCSDNAEAVDGMPVSLQLVAQRLEEEKAVGMTRVILQAL